MAGPWEKYAATPLQDTAEAGPWTKFGAPAGTPPAAPEAPGLLRKGADLALDFTQGAYGAIGAGASAFGADNLVAKGATAISDYAVELQSQQRQAERLAQAQRMQDAEATGSMWEEAKAAGQNVLDTPLSFFASALGSLVPTVAASVVGGAPAALTLGAGMGAGAVKQSVAERVEQEALKAGQTPEQAAAAAAAAQAYQGDNLDQIALGAGLGALAGGTGVERLMGGGASAIKNIVGRAAAGAVTEAVPESVQGGQERLAANVAAQREGFGGDTWTGVVGQGVTEGLASTGPGGIAGAMTPYLDPNAGPISRAAIKAQEQQAAGALPAPGQLSGEAAMQMGDSVPGQDPTGALNLQRRNTELQDARAKQEAERAAVDPTYLDRINGRQAAPQQTTAAPVTDASSVEQGLPFTQPPYAGPAPTVGEQGSRWADPRIAIAGEPIPDPAAQLEIDRPSTQDQFLAAQRKRAQGELLSQSEAALLNGPDPFEGQTVSLASPADPAAVAAREEAVQDVAFANGDEPANVRVFSSQDLPDGPSGNQRGAGLTRPAAAVIEGLGRLFGTQYRFYDSPNAATRGDGFVLRGRRPGVAYVRATEGDAAPLVVAGHETYHTFTPAERARFSAAIEPFVDVSDVAQLAFLSDYTGGRYQAKVVQLVQAGIAPTEVIDAVIDQAQQDGTANLTRAALREEFDADIFGNRMKDTGFWEKVFTELKAQDRTLLVKIRDSIKQVVSYLKSQAGKVRGFDTDRYIRDLDAVQRIAARTLLSAANTQQKGERGSRGAVDVVRSEVRDRLGPYPSESFANMNKDWYAKKEGVQYAVEQAADGYYLTRTGATNEGQGQAAGRLDRGRDAGSAADAGRGGQGDSRATAQRGSTGRGESAPRQGRTPLAVESRVRTDERGAVSLTGVHYSREPRRALSGSYYGTGLKGAEGRRLAGVSDRRLLQRVYAYVNEGKGVRPEAGVGSYPHTVEMSNLYDLAADPLKLYREHGGDLNLVESAILDVGFDGYYVRDAFGNQGAAVVLGDASIGLQAQQVEVGADVVRSPKRTLEKENQVSVTVGGKPGEFGWSPAAKLAAAQQEPAVDPAKLIGKEVPPFVGPTQQRPNLEVIGESVRKVLAAKPARDTIEALTGAKVTGVSQIAGSWEGKPEPSFVLSGEMSFEQANEVSNVLGFLMAQDATVAAQPWFEETDDQIPAILISQNKVMTAEQVKALSDAAREAGLDYSTTVDGRGAKFLHFGDQDGFRALSRQVTDIAKAAGLKEVTPFHVRSNLNDAETYLESGVGSALRGTGDEVGTAGPSDLFRRAVDSILVPYAKAVGAEGYRFSPERYGRRFGLTDGEVEYIRAALRPKSGKALSTVPLVTGAEKLEPPRNNARTKERGVTKNDLLWALQGRTAQVGFIEPGDYSPEARKIIADAIADEVIYNLGKESGKNAVGWYDAALKKAKETYERVFPELRQDKDREMLFDAILGVASQGNDVHSNAVFAGRMYHLITREGMTLGQATKALSGTFGKQTVAIEKNYAKLEHLLDTNGYDRMREFFNTKATVGELNAILRKDESLFGPNGKPLKIDGAAEQTVSGWMVFGPKIGSFINNLHGDYSTLTADLWFSRTWNRMLGYVFNHKAGKENDQYVKLYRAMVEEARTGVGRDLVGTSQAEIDAWAADPESMLTFARETHLKREAEYKTIREEAVTPLRQAAKNLLENREEATEIPRTDWERFFQQTAVEQAQKTIRRKTGVNISIADIQAVLWYHEKDLYKSFGVGDSKAESADYADAAARFVDRFNEGELFFVEKPKPRYVVGEKGSYLTRDGDVSRSTRRGQTDSAAFKKWFGDSKVVDASGQPLVVYHGTDSVFTEFSRTGDIGYHFGTEIAARDRAARVGGAEVLVEPVTLSQVEKDSLASLNGEIGGTPAADLYALLLRKLDSPRQNLRAQVEAMPADEIKKVKAEYLEQPDSLRFAERVDRAKAGEGFRVEVNGETVSTHRTVREANARAARLREQAATPTALYLRIENPIRLPDLGVWPAQEIAKEAGFSKREMERVVEAGTAEQQYEAVRAILESKGFDGIVYRNEVEHAGEDSYIAFRPEQIKSATGNAGTFDPADPDITRSTRRNELGFYSQLSRAVDASKFQTQPAGQWKLWLASNAAKAGVKADEVQWSGINEWLELQGKRKVEKAEVLQYLEQGGVQIQEVQKGARPRPRWEETVGDGGPLWAFGDYSIGYSNRKYWPEGPGLRNTYGMDSLAAAKARIELYLMEEGLVDDSGAFVDTKYGHNNLVLPGGENYREVLLTLPEPDRAAAAKKAGYTVRKAPWGWQIVNPAGDGIGMGTGATADEALADWAQVAVAHTGGRAFKSGHWDEQNVLAHMRLDDRTTTDGRRVLFVEEIQSDWGQAGRDAGFGDVANWTDAQIRAAVEENDPNADTEGLDRATLLEMARNSGVTLASSVPAAPFVQDTKSWVSLVLKRVISMAAEGGYDAVAVVNGQQSADRYSLRKQIESIGYDPKTQTLTGYNTRRAEVLNQAGVAPAQVADYVGKEVAQRLLATELSMGKHLLSGEEIEVGGDGMKAFYDRIVPQVANDVLKKLGGGRVAPVPIRMPYRNSGDRNMVVNAFRDQMWSKYGDGFMLKITPEEAAQLRALEQGRSQTQLGFDITPAMREKVTGDGLPLFSAARTRFEPETHRDFQRDLARAVGKLNGKSETSYKEGYHQPILVMRTPPVLRSVYERAKANSRPFRQSDSVVGTGATIYLKSQNKFKGANHGRPVDGLAVQRLPYLIADPLAVFQSTETGEDPNSFKVLGADSRGFFVAAIKPGYTMDGASKKTNFSATIFPVQLGQVADWVKKGALRYWDDRLQKAEAQGMTGAIPGFLGPLSRSEGAGWLPGGPKSIGEIFSLAKAPVKIITRSELEGTPETMLSARRAQTETPEFKRWFGDSKVVDAAGQPRVVYHGTRADIAAFDPDAVGRNFGLDDVGFFFTGSPIKAASYADPESAFAQAGMRPTREPEEGANIIPAYLSLQNPLTLEAYTDYFDSTPAYEIDEQGISITDYFDDNRRNIVSIAQEGGHDGVLFQHRGDLLGVVFSPAQIKSATGNTGAFDPADQDITRSAPRANFGTMTQAQEDALRAVGLLREPKTISERFADLTDNLAKRLTQGVVDQYAPLKELDFRSYVLARMSKGTDGTFEAMLYYGRPQIAGDTVEIDTAPGGLMEVLSTLSGEQDRFLAWIAANRAEQLTAEGREFLFTPEQIRELKGLNQGQMADGRGRQVEYARVLREFNAFQDSVLAIAEARGLIDAQSRQVWRDGFYVPFYRNMEDGTTGPSVKSGLVNQYAFKKLKGSSRQLNEDLLANTLQNMAHLLSAAAKNQAASASLRAAESAGVAHRVPRGTKGAVRFLDAGREQHYLVDDPFIYDAITSLESVKVVGLEKVLSKFKHWLTMGVTINPAFQLRSLMRDAIQSIAITNIDTNPLANVKQGIASQLNKDQDYINALASGGLIRFNSLLEGNRADHTRKLIKMGVADSTILDTREKVEMFFTKALDKWLAVGDISESTNRMALYKQQIAAGVDPLLAAYQARDLMDFSMQGQWRAVRFLTQVVPFLNARLQGLYKLGRDGVVPTGRVLFGGGDATDKQIAKRFGAVTGAVAMASIALMAAYADDEDWKKREDWDRDTYWWFKIGDTAFRIPKPFEVGAIGTIAERTAELFMTDDLSGDRFLQRLGHMMSSTFALNPIPQMVKPLLDVYANEESFTQRPIETMGMERLQPQDRFTGSTSELAKWLGQLGLPEPGRLMSGQYQALSPVQIDALIRGYFSWLGVSATRVVDMGVRAVADRPVRPEMQLRDVFFAGNFLEGLPANSSRYVTALYDQSKAIESAYASYRFALRQGDQARATELLAEDGDKIRLNPLVTRAKQTLSKLNENIRAIERSTTMSAAEKRNQIDRIKAMQNQIAMRTSAQIQ